MLVDWEFRGQNLHPVGATFTRIGFKEVQKCELVGWNLTLYCYSPCLSQDESWLISRSLHELFGGRSAHVPCSVCLRSVGGDGFYENGMLVEMNIASGL